jgi:hypothetical protein
MCFLFICVKIVMCMQTIGYLPGIEEEDDFRALAAIDDNTKKQSPGPSTYEELENWPLWNLQCLDSRPELAANFLKMVMPGTLNTTGYSGLDCPREVGHQLSLAIAKKFGLDERPRFSFVRACDNSRLPQDVLIQLSKKSYCICVSPDILGSLTVDMQKFLEALEPSAALRTSERSEDRMQAASMYQTMLDWLITNREWLFPADATFPCLVHVRNGISNRCRLDPCGRDPLLDEHDSTLVFNWGGTTCHGWSSVGDSGGFCDASEKTQAVFVTQRVRMAELNKEDGFFGEWTVKYPVEIKLAIPISPWMFAVWIKADACKMGWPNKRHRMLSFGGCRNRQALVVKPFPYFWLVVP